ncbi:hypothetical protein SPRG_05184 [Saprolegnia parasitica CBS 223.65]|uniref:Kri1-like C-terminal domain-containing protein n=1 Tax=Saprolegnia parasitica (strain CBS 223.65) TaxID=695850 RepID=A0A067CLA2_SAPPC|nr:hypothetical protein SPRG_05184 [Saprolegnia parasitica CBS 223.65]KDO29995.1 hypothetical protein SPRG_05184 [Saprolegnia parasitica CBS 223.65]|eukprot:XP_012199178.1 hypothetical protein SPRG_05184 [Saprolegnia parasitica CBS 223.65]
MAGKEIFGDDGAGLELTVNSKFADQYIERKRKEELSKHRYDDDDESSDSETEDEDGDQLTTELDKDISRTLKLIRSKDPSIYDSKISFFEQGSDDEDEDEEDGEAKKAKKTKKTKPLYYKDLVRQQVLAGDLNSDESDDEPPVTTYADEQKKLKGDFLQSVAAEADDEEELDGGLFTVRQKTADDEEREAADFKAFQEENPDAVDELDADAFLAKFMKSGAWKEKRKTPSYAEIVGTDKVDDEEDADELDKADAFEHSYNFRFEEEGAGQIQTFSRVVEDSMRRKDDKRKKDREERKARKAIERQKKEDELRRLKNLRQAEIQSKIDKVMALMGPTKSALTVTDVDGAFDPEEHDRRMAQVFNDDYYGEEAVDENGKPVWEDDDDVFGKLPEEDEEDDDEDDDAKATAPVTEDDDEANDDEPMDDAADEVDEEMPENLTVEEIKAMKQKYLDELYALDYEDIIGDMPCRFKYKTVEKNDYGLTTMDILDADDKDLKSVVSLKRLAPYVDREYSVNRRKVQQLRKQLRSKRSAKKPVDEVEEAAPAATEEVAAESTEGKKSKSRKRKRKSKTVEETEEPSAVVDEEVAVPTEDASAESSKKKRKQKKKKTEKTPDTGLSASRLESYRLKPLK